MKPKCRDTTTATSNRRQLAMTELLRGARVVTDPEKLAYLNAQAAKCKARTKGK